MNRWGDRLWIFTPEEYNQLPDGMILTCINGKDAIKGVDEIDMDIRFGHMAYGVENPTTHPQSELFSVFMLKQ